ncbi:MAG: hypothetical protein IPI19_10770 [Ignavibacteriales bacterium]|nr:hypothetical protein [Ignavibacteriales bacterium]
MNTFPEYRYKGASALVKLHEIHLQSFYETWKEAKQLNIKLPDSDDPYYKSLDTLLYHLLRSARGYMIWMCDKLGLEDPQIKETPLAEMIEQKAVEQLAHLFERWRLPLADVEPELFEDKVYKSNWSVEYCIDAMLEHAVMHPIRHEFQLKNLIQIVITSKAK